MPNSKPLSSTSSSSDDDAIPDILNIIEDVFESETEDISSNMLQEDSLKENRDDSNYLNVGLLIKDIEEKSSDILIENIKLKDILKRKDDAIRKRFNTILIFEKEVIQICENYKARFSEIKNLVDHLKQENKKINITITSGNVQGSSTICDSTFEESNAKVKNLSISPPDVKVKDEAITQTTALESKLHAKEDLKDLLKKIEDITVSHVQLQSKLEKSENQREAELEQFDNKLKKCQKDLELLKEKLTLPKKSKLLRLIKEDYKKELERKYMVEIVKLLEQKIEISGVNRGTQTEKTIREFDSQKEKWCEFVECFIKQCIQNTDLNKFQIGCKNIVQTFKNTELSCDNNFIDVTHKKNDIFCDYRKILIDEQLQCIKDERMTLNVQRQFLKALADYNNIIAQLEILKLENSTATEVKDIPNFAEIEKCLLEEKKIVDIERETITEERLNIEKEKQSIREDWELLSAEKVVLLQEKDQLLEESKRLKLEDSQLKQKIVVFKNENIKRINSVALDKKLQETTAELDNLKGELENADETIANLRTELSKLNNQESEIMAYQLQAEMQEAEFVAMRQAEQNYLQQIENLSTEIHQLREGPPQLHNANDLG